jgi:hypothetical protein
VRTRSLENGFVAFYQIAHNPIFGKVNMTFTMTSEISCEQMVAMLPLKGIPLFIGN